MRDIQLAKIFKNNKNDEEVFLGSEQKEMVPGH